MSIINKQNQAKAFTTRANGITLMGHTKEYDTYEDMQAETNPLVMFAKVIDASGDPTVTEGWAEYAKRNNSWIKTMEQELIDDPMFSGTVTWENVTDKPDLKQLYELPINIPGTIDTDSATALATIVKFPMVWNLPDATIEAVSAKVLTAVSTGDAPAINPVIDSTAVLSSALSLTETLAAGTIDADNKTIHTGDTLDINLTCGNGDAEDVIIFIKLKAV